LNVPKKIKIHWYLYILKCADDSLYTGITDDLNKRVAAHNAGTGAKYTRGRGPVQLIYWEHYLAKSDALRREAAVKKLTRQQKQQLCEQFCGQLQYLSTEHGELLCITDDRALPASCYLQLREAMQLECCDIDKTAAALRKTRNVTIWQGGSLAACKRIFSDDCYIKYVGEVLAYPKYLNMISEEK